MSKKFVIAVSTLLICCFLILLTCGLVFVYSTPNPDTIIARYKKAGCTHSNFDFGKLISTHTFIKDDQRIYIIWYKDEESAENGLNTLCKMKGDEFYVVKRGNAVAMGDKDLIKIFKAL